MSPSQIYEPTYKAIKNMLMSGLLVGGARLDTARIARQLGVSASPVRDSLNHLAGEGLVDFAAGVGFQVAKLNVHRLENLLDLNLALLNAAVPDETSPVAVISTFDGGPAERAAALFHAIGFLSGNLELANAIDALGERLWPARLLDSRVLTAPLSVLDRLQTALCAKEGAPAIRQLLVAYHAERKRKASAYARLLAESRD